jgi:poly-gamma-glutamate synthesis protein (capsule biosynthesis protein)
VAPLIRRADWAVGNLETRLAGKKAGYSGYPNFNAPDRLAYDLARTGFDVLVTANNHSLDRGVSGVHKTHEAVRAAGMEYVGTHDSHQDRDRIRMLDRNGVRLALLAYTYGVNGPFNPDGRRYLINFIDAERMTADVDAARRAGADFVVCFLHFGDEYQRTPSDDQRRIAHGLIRAGADVVLGCHPHVVQPYEMVPTVDGDKVVVYSMGNFISNQLGRHTRIGAMFNLVFSKDFHGRKRVEHVTAVPIATLRVLDGRRRSYRVLPLRRALDRGLPEHLTLSAEVLRTYLAEIEAHLISLSG